jgi:hypothetical protein
MILALILYGIIGICAFIWSMEILRQERERVKAYALAILVGIFWIIFLLVVWIFLIKLKYF